MCLRLARDATSQATFASETGILARSLTSTADVRLIVSLDIGRKIKANKIKTSWFWGFDGGEGCRQIVGTNPVLRGFILSNVVLSGFF